ncbi:unnamed protein product [Amoebophrya sp. A25]|nr:unnamed protein product [Amoebophrya sp. A25]|eukprot:GSA25T00027134001.1
MSYLGMSRGAGGGQYGSGWASSSSATMRGQRSTVNGPSRMNAQVVASSNRSTATTAAPNGQHQTNMKQKTTTSSNNAKSLVPPKYSFPETFAKHRGEFDAGKDELRRSMCKTGTSLNLAEHSTKGLLWDTAAAMDELVQNFYDQISIRLTEELFESLSKRYPSAAAEEIEQISSSTLARDLIFRDEQDADFVRKRAPAAYSGGGGNSSSSAHQRNGGGGGSYAKLGRLYYKDYVVGALALDHPYIYLCNYATCFRPCNFIIGFTGPEKKRCRKIAKGRFGDGLDSSISKLLSDKRKVDIFSCGYRYCFDYRAASNLPDGVKQLHYFVNPMNHQTRLEPQPPQELLFDREWDTLVRIYVPQFQLDCSRYLFFIQPDDLQRVSLSSSSGTSSASTTRGDENIGVSTYSSDYEILCGNATRGRIYVKDMQVINYYELRAAAGPATPAFGYNLKSFDMKFRDRKESLGERDQREQIVAAWGTFFQQAEQKTECRAGAEKLAMQLLQALVSGGNSALGEPLELQFFHDICNTRSTTSRILSNTSSTNTYSSTTINGTSAAAAPSGVSNSDEYATLICRYLKNAFREKHPDAIPYWDKESRAIKKLGKTAVMYPRKVTELLNAGEPTPEEQLHALRLELLKQGPPLSARKATQLLHGAIGAAIEKGLDFFRLERGAPATSTTSGGKANQIGESTASSSASASSSPSEQHTTGGTTAEGLCADSLLQMRLVEVVESSSASSKRKISLRDVVAAVDGQSVQAFELTGFRNSTLNRVYKSCCSGTSSGGSRSSGQGQRQGHHQQEKDLFIAEKDTTTRRDAREALLLYFDPLGQSAAIVPASSHSSSSSSNFSTGATSTRSTADLALARMIQRDRPWWVPKAHWRETKLGNTSTVRAIPVSQSPVSLLVNIAALRDAMERGRALNDSTLGKAQWFVRAVLKEAREGLERLRFAFVSDADFEEEVMADAMETLLAHLPNDKSLPTDAATLESLIDKLPTAPSDSNMRTISNATTSTTSSGSTSSNAAVVRPASVAGQQTSRQQQQQQRPPTLEFLGDGGDEEEPEGHHDAALEEDADFGDLPFQELSPRADQLIRATAGRNGGIISFETLRQGLLRELYCDSLEEEAGAAVQDKEVPAVEKADPDAQHSSRRNREDQEIQKTHEQHMKKATDAVAVNRFYNTDEELDTRMKRSSKDLYPHSDQAEGSKTMKRSRKDVAGDREEASKKHKHERFVIQKDGEKQQDKEVWVSKPSPSGTSSSSSSLLQQASRSKDPLGRTFIFEPPTVKRQLSPAPEVKEQKRTSTTSLVAAADVKKTSSPTTKGLSPAPATGCVLSKPKNRPRVYNNRSSLVLTQNDTYSGTSSAQYMPTKNGDTQNKAAVASKSIPSLADNDKAGASCNDIPASSSAASSSKNAVPVVLTARTRFRSMMRREEAYFANPKVQKLIQKQEKDRLRVVNKAIEQSTPLRFNVEPLLRTQEGRASRLLDAPLDDSIQRKGKKGPPGITVPPELDGPLVTPRMRRGKRGGKEADAAEKGKGKKGGKKR